MSSVPMVNPWCLAVAKKHSKMTLDTYDLLHTYIVIHSTDPVSALIAPEYGTCQ